jgi:hypothetical protein
MTIINRSTFTLIQTREFSPGLFVDEGTIEATLGGKTRTVKAWRYHSNLNILRASGFTGRYQTSGKAWPALVTLHANGNESATFGRDDRSAKFRKIDRISFAGA